jgi:serine/threonine protein phosphatase PrpC
MYRGIQAVARALARPESTTKFLAQGSMNLEFTQISDRGKVREGNEDYLGYVEPGSPEEARTRGWLFAVADGVGGHDLGEVASRAAIESLVAGFRAATPGEAHPALMTRLVRDANARVVHVAHDSSAGGSNMATTIVSCALRYDRATVAHVGDSRCYLVRRGQAAILTRDHTVASEHVRLGILSAQEAAGAETRHLLSRSLGSALTVSVDTAEHQVFADDVLVLCSDGLHGSVTPSEIAALTGNNMDLNRAAQRLVDIANQRDGSDNISLQIIRVRSVERVGMYRGRPYRLP